MRLGESIEEASRITVRGSRYPAVVAGALSPAAVGASGSQGGPNLHLLGDEGRHLAGSMSRPPAHQAAVRQFDHHSMMSPGTRLDAYEIIEPIGAGGMGEVYKATDTRIGRTVAIKVLPAGALGNPDAESRFEREARALASLSHPRICPLFEFTRHGDSALRIMEYLQGEPLSARMVRGRLPIKEALRIAAEIADGLAAAHRAGLVHRDLKPGNVMLTRSGAKLLDFGLAKTSVGECADAVTETLGATRPGVAVGTVPYMAPEQLTGRAVDQRADIWALGCVLYEMVTGGRAFPGAAYAEVVAAILERDPPPMSTVVPEAAPSIGSPQSAWHRIPRHDGRAPPTCVTNYRGSRVPRGRGRRWSADARHGPTVWLGRPSRPRSSQSPCLPPASGRTGPSPRHRSGDSK